MNSCLSSRCKLGLFACLLWLAGFSVSAQFTTVTSGNRYCRGSGTDFSYYSFVIPLDGQQGVIPAPSLATTYAGLKISNLYHLNATNTGNLNVNSNRVAISNAVAAFGSKYGGSPLYINQNYHFGVYAGDFTSQPALLITSLTNGAFSSSNQFLLPIVGSASNWPTFIRDGAVWTNTDTPGLTVTFAQSPGGQWGADYNGTMELTFTANSGALGREYTIWAIGLVESTNWIVVTNTTHAFWSPICTLSFGTPPPLLPNFVSQPQFQGTPVPPAYEGKSLTELLATKAVVNNTVTNTATNWVDLDNSPELREHPVLDQFVTDMGSNALALTAYVFNEIQLTDGVAYNSNTNKLLDTSINLGGMNRGAYATFMEGQGSPMEQCALLIYLLRRAGVPAGYIFPPTNGVQMLDTRLSDILQMQIHGAVDQANGQAYTSNTLISVNYPWVAAYIQGQWVHLFPWIKDTEVTEGLNLYDYMPANYNNGYKWVRQYLTADPSILSLSADSDAPSTLFPLFIQNALLTSAPGASVDDIGTTVVNRQVQYSRWSDFPTPFAVTNGAVNSVRDLTAITNIYPNWTNIWDTINIWVYSAAATNKFLDTGDLRLVDLQDRKFLLRTTNSGSSYGLILSLAPFRPGATATNSFTNDPPLLNQQTMTLGLTTSDPNLTVVFTRKRHLTEPTAITNNGEWSSYLGVSETLQYATTSSIKLGDLAAICLHSGMVSKEMLTPWAQEYWTMQQDVAVTPSLTNTISKDITQGTLPYLMGMSYFERVDRARTMFAQLHKVQIGSVIGQGLSIIAAERTNSGALMLPINLYHPHVDMHEAVMTSFGNSTLRPDESADPVQAADSCFRLYTTEASAQEHKITEDFYHQASGVSSVKLLWMAQALNPTNMVELNVYNFINYVGTIGAYDPTIWGAILDTFYFSQDNFANVFITAMPITNATVGYQGMGALIYANNHYSALISGNGLPANSGWGEPFAYPFYNPPDYGNIDLSFNTSDDYNWSVTYDNPFQTVDPLAEQFATWTIPSITSGLSGGQYYFGGFDSAQQLSFDFAAFSLGVPEVDTLSDAVNFGGNYLSHIGPGYAQASGTAADPVNLVTGEFYISATDLTLPGAMPLFIRRNYSSQDVDMGDTPFGTGWRPAYTPYLRLVTNNVIYAAELDGTVVAYRQPVTGTNFWQPIPADNPGLNYRSEQGIGSTANLFNNFITTNITGGTTNYVLTGADGGVRKFQWMGFPIATATNSFARPRPYLQTWTDANGNSYTFTYQTDGTQPDYGEVLYIRSSNGNFLGFYYDVYGHITQAYLEDGRRLFYDYDSHGDLVTVTLPDESQINYVYQHTNSVTNSVTNVFSTHLITQEQKPNGRTLAIWYDSLRRVTTQAATVGAGLGLVTNATFVYSNTFANLTNSIITGTTWTYDVFGRPTIYRYTTNLITSITDPLSQIETMIWFTNSSDTGYYPHSLKSRTDKRGLNTAYQYDSRGNLVQAVLTGNLTGGTLTNETATSAFVYNSHNLIATNTDPLGNQTLYAYADPNHPFLPTTVTRVAGGTVVSTNQFFYTNVSQVVSYDAGTTTDYAYGLLVETILGNIGSNAFAYDGRGFKIAMTNYPGTGDPAVSKSYFYSDRGDLVQETDALGRSREFAYDPLGRITEDEVYEAGAAIPLAGKYSYYNANGDLVWTDGPKYNPQDYTWRDYDGAGRKITELRWRSEALPNGTGVQASSNLYATTFYQYDPFNDRTNIIDALGNSVAQKFDGLGRMTNQTFYAANGTALATNVFSYEPGGEIAVFTNAIGGITTKHYTSAGRLMSQQNPDGSAQAWRYDLSGRVTTNVIENGNYWQTVYSAAALTVTKTFYNSSSALASTVATYDPRGNLVAYTDEDGNTCTNWFDSLNRVKVAAGPVSPVLIYTNLPSTGALTNYVRLTTTTFYDNCGRTLTTSNALGEMIVRTNDALGRPVGIGVYPTNSTTPVRDITAGYGTNNNSVTITNGTGSAAIVSTVYLDNDGHPVLTIGYPNSGTNEFVYQQYDLVGNRIARQQCSSTGGTVTVWATNGWTYDGLNRVATETSGDGATTTYTRDALGNVIQRAMPGGLSWFAAYLNDGRMASEVETNGGLAARSMAYTYYTSGSPFVGLPDTVTDGRGTVQTFGYDDFRRLTTNSSTGSLAQQKTLTTYQYDPVGLLLTLGQSFATNTTGPATVITRAYDANRHVTYESTSVAGSGFSEASESWDLAGRRVGLNDEVFGYQADGLMTLVADGAGVATFGYANNGMLSSRSNFSRMYSVTARDGRGRILTTSTTAGVTTPLGETLAWRNDGRLSSYVAARGDFTDTHSYSYTPLTQRLSQESLDVSAGVSVTENYTNDFGVAGGLGILTGAGQAGGVIWATNGLDGLSRVSMSHDTVITRTANGVCLGAQIITGTLDGKPVNVEYGGTDSPGNWHTSLALTPGSHTLIMSGVDPSGTIFAGATNTFTANGGASDTITNTYDGNGNVTQRIWISSGVTNRVQTFTWDAFNRQIKLADRDSSANGWDFASVFDGLGRRIQTTQTMVTNGVGITSPPETVTTVDTTYDPGVEFLKTSVSVNGLRTTLSYGPDASGTYGGMQGMGGLEAIQPDGFTFSYGVIQDYFGNSLGVISNSIAYWNPARFGSYGPVPGYQPPPLSQFTTVQQSMGWHGFWPDPGGDYALNARGYDPNTGRFLSTDPLGHGASLDLYSFCHGDPVNFFDPCGRLGMPINSELETPGLQSPAGVVMEGRDYIAEMQLQRIEAAFVNLVTLGIADPLVGMFTGQNMTGDEVDRGQSTGRFVQAVLLAPVLVPGLAGAAENALISLGDAGIIDIGESLLPATEGQVESEVLRNNTSGQMIGLEAAPIQGSQSMGMQLLPTLRGNIPDAAKWVDNGGTVQYYPSGGMTYILKDGTAVTYNSSGFPNFSPYRYQGSDGLSQVRITLTGSRSLDNTAANAAAGFQQTPLGYTWHHDEDVGLMELIEEDVHAAFPHTGGFSLGNPRD